jgi:hypothetical protein
MNSNLVLARVGRNSLHPSWIERGTPRDWDLHLVPYQPIDSEPDLDCNVADVIPGPKWSGLRELLNRWDGWRDYDYIWMPDDDIQADQAAISRIFEVARGVGLDLFAPALDESSHYAHFTTMRNRRAFGRWVGFVEIMMPGFSRGALDTLLPTLDLTETGWGWGLDSVWPKLLGYKNVGIIDGVPVVHTRPVGQMRDLELVRRVHEESDSLLASYDCRQMHNTVALFGPNLKEVELSREALLDELTQGWGYLIEKDPRVLDWIVGFQRPESGFPDYPIAGTPC